MPKLDFRALMDSGLSPQDINKLRKIAFQAESGDESAKQLLSDFPEVQLIPQQKPIGFLGGVSEGLTGESDPAKLPGLLREGLPLLFENKGETAFRLLSSALFESQKAQFGKVGETLERRLGEVGAQETTIGKGVQALKGGVELAGQTLAALTPVLGPAIAATGETIGRGEIARGAGQAVGLLTPFVAGEAALRVRPAVTKTVGGIPKLFSERATGIRATASRYLEGLTEKTFPGGDVLKRYRANQQRAIIESPSENVIKTILAGSDELPSSQFGRSAKNAIDEGIRHIREQEGALYAEIDSLVGTKEVRVPVFEERLSSLIGARGEALTFEKRVLRKRIVGGVQPETVTLKRFAIQVKRRLNQQKKLLDPRFLEEADGIASGIIRSPKRLPFKVFQDSRSDLLRITRRFDELLPGKAAGIAMKLSSLTDKAMIQAAESSGIPNLVAKVRGANEFVRNNRILFNETVISKLADTAPERLPTLLRNATLEDIAAFKRVLPRPLWNQVRASYIRQGLLQATVGEIAPQLLGENITGFIGNATEAGLRKMGLDVTIRPETSPVFKGSRFKSFLEGETPVTKGGSERLFALLDSPAERGAVLKLIQEADTVSQRGQPGLIAPGVNAYILYQGGSSIYGSITGGGLAALSGAITPLVLASGLYITARLMTSSRGITALRSAIRAVGRGDVRMISFWSSRMAQIFSQQASEEEKRLLRQGAPPPRLGATIEERMAAKNQTL